MITTMRRDTPSVSLGEYMAMLYQGMVPEMRKMGILLGMDDKAAATLAQLSRRPGDMDAVLWFAGFAGFDSGISRCRFGIDLTLSSQLTDAQDNRKIMTNPQLINKLSSVTGMLHRMCSRDIQAGRIEPESSDWIRDLETRSVQGHRIFFTLQVALSYP